MEKHDQFAEYITEFLREYSGLVKENTLKRYGNDLALFKLYFERYGPGDLRMLSWKHMEEFFSWWYLRQYIGCSLSGMRGLFATLKKFCLWLDKKGLAEYHTAWKQEESRILKNNVERVLMWEREVAEKRAVDDVFWFEGDLEHTEVSEGWFKVIHTFRDKAALRDLDSNSAYIVRFEGLIARYIKPGDIISAALCRDDRGFYINDNIVWFFYPPTASEYLR